MSVLHDTAKVSGEHVHLRNSDLLLNALVFTDLENRLHIFNSVQVWHITTIEDIVDVLEHLLIHDLGVDEEEGCWLVLDTSLHEANFDVFSPVHHAVALDYLDLEQLLAGNERRQSR